MAVFNTWLANLMISSRWPAQAGSNMPLFLFGYMKTRNCAVNQHVQDHPGKPAWRMQPSVDFYFCRLWMSHLCSVPRFLLCFPLANKMSIGF